MDEFEMYKTLNKLFARLCKENNVKPDECKEIRKYVIPFIVGDLAMMQEMRGHRFDKRDVELYGETQFHAILRGAWKPAFTDYER